MADTSPTPKPQLSSETTILPSHLGANDPHGDDPRMVTLTREGKEIACVTAADGPDCCIEAAVMLLNQRHLRIGDQLTVTRI